MATATLLYRSKTAFADGATQEMVLWALPHPTPDRPHRLKYRLYYGLADGTCLVRYDNESGKGEHRHIEDREVPYAFKDVETLVRDFFNDVVQACGGSDD